MPRTAKEIMLTDFPFVDCNVTVAEAEDIFEAARVAALPVLNPDRTVFGLLTLRHLAAFYRRRHGNPRACHSWEICDVRPLVGAPTDGLRDVAAALLMDDARYVLIVNDERQLVGIISAEMLIESGLEPGGKASEPVRLYE